MTGVLQDISEPKIRVEGLETSFHLEENDVIKFVKEEIIEKQITQHSYRTVLSQPRVLDQVKVDDYIYFYDKMIRIRVIEVSADDVSVRVQNSGILSLRKWVNFPNTYFGIDVITPKDRKDIL